MNIYEIANELIRSSEYKTEKEFQIIIDTKKNVLSAIIPHTDTNKIIIFEGVEKFSMYEYIKNEFYHMKGEIKNTVTMKDFVKSLNQLIIYVKKENKEITKELINKMFDDILEKPIKTYTIIKGVYGIKLNNNEKG